MKCYVIKVFLKCRYQVCSNPKPLINSFRASVTSAKISLQQNMYRANDALKPGDGLEICMQHSELFFIFFFLINTCRIYGGLSQVSVFNI